MSEKTCEKCKASCEQLYLFNDANLCPICLEDEFLRWAKENEEGARQTKCEEKGCNKPASTHCRLYDHDKKKYIHFEYCEEHAPKNGFCLFCGEFWGGVESFDFAESYGGIKGYCENCSEDIKCELGE